MTLTWRKSTFSASGGDCVELARADHHVLVRNSHRPDAGTLAVSPADLGTWLAGCRDGALDDLDDLDDLNHLAG